MHAAGAHYVAAVAPNIDPGAELADAVTDQQTVRVEIQMSAICGDHDHRRQKQAMLGTKP
jgi:hypothetical protein